MIIDNLEAAVATQFVCVVVVVFFFFFLEDTAGETNTVNLVGHGQFGSDFVHEQTRQPD